MKDKKPVPRRDDDIKEKCSTCGRTFVVTPFAHLADAIMRNKPRCPKCIRKSKRRREKGT